MKIYSTNKVRLRNILFTLIVLHVLLIVPGARASEEITLEDVYPEDGATEVELGPDSETELRVRVEEPRSEEDSADFYKVEDGRPTEIIGVGQIDKRGIAEVVWDGLEHNSTYYWFAETNRRELGISSFTTEAAEEDRSFLDDITEGFEDEGKIKWWTVVLVGIVIIGIIVGLIILKKRKERSEEARMKRDQINSGLRR